MHENSLSMPRCCNFFVLRDSASTSDQLPAAKPAEINIPDFSQFLLLIDDDILSDLGVKN